MSWKDDFGNRATACLDHELVRDVRKEFEWNMRSRCDISSGLPAYGLSKVMRTVAVASAAVALGIDPDALRLDREEANEAILALAAAFGDRAILIDPSITAEQAADEIKRRLDAESA